MINTLIEIISIILPVIIIIGLGYIWNKIGNNLNQKDLSYLELPEEKIIFGKKNNFTLSSLENSFE